MVKIPIKTLCLVLCFVEAAFLLAAQAIGSMVLILPCLICFLALIVWASIQNMAMPVCLFFLPFASLLKLGPDTLSFFTLALLIVYAICAVRGHRNVSIAHMVPGLLLVILTLIVKIAEGHAVTNEYVLFAISLLAVPFLITEIDAQRYDFYWVTMYFILGILLAAFSSLLLSNFPSIARYINVVGEVTVSRRAGFTYDPNFYSAHITIALSGVFVLLLNHVDKVKRIILIVTVVLLTYCGLLSVSKSFLLVSACVVFCWFFSFLFRKGRISAKILTILTLLIVLVYILSSSVFSDLLDLMLLRMSDSTTLSDFTTHRTDLWGSYMRAFGADPWLTLFGSGYSRVLVNDRAAHNTLIQAVFQFGLVGSICMAAWYVCLTRTLLTGSYRRRPDLAQTVILCIGCFGPWMGLDYLFCDETFLVPIYMCIAIRFLKQPPTPILAESSVDE